MADHNIGGSTFRQPGKNVYGVPVYKPLCRYRCNNVKQQWRKSVGSSMIAQVIDWLRAPCQSGVGKRTGRVPFVRLDLEQLLCVPDEALHVHRQIDPRVPALNGLPPQHLRIVHDCLQTHTNHDAQWLPIEVTIPECAFS